MQITFFNKLFGIRKGEYPKTLLMFSYLMFLVMTLRMGRMIKDTFIVSRLGPEKLAFSYLGVGLALAFVLFIYFRIADSFKRISLLSWTSLVFCISLLFSRWILTLHFRWFYQFLYIWIEAFGAVMMIQFSTLASDIFNTREAKRLFGFILAGGVVGSIIGGFIIRNTSQILDPENLIYVLAGAVFICFLIINAIPKIIDGAKTFSPKVEVQQNIFNLILTSKHIQYISIITLIVAAVSTIIDFQYQNVLGEIYRQSETGLLRFYGTFYLILGIVSLIFQTFFTSRILIAMGLLCALLVFPSTILFGTMAVLFGIYKWPLIINKCSDYTFKYTIDSSARQIATFPIPTEIRGRIKAFVEGIVRYGSQGLIGVIIFLVVIVLKIHFAKLSYLILALIAAWIFYIFKLKKEYINSIMDGLKERSIDLQEVELKVTDSLTIKLLIDTLKEEDPSRVLYALDMLEGISTFNLKPHLLGLLNHRAPEVKIHALKKLESISSQTDKKIIFGMTYDPHCLVKAQAIQTYCKLLKTEAVKDIEPLLESKNPDIKASAILGLIKYAEIDGILTAADDLKRMLESPSPGEKAKAAEILGELNIKYFNVWIEKFINDKSQEVQYCAIEAAGKIKHTELASKIIPKLSQRGLKSVTFHSLKNMGTEICNEIDTWIGDPVEEDTVRTSLPKVLAEIDTEHSLEILFKHIESAEEKIRKEVIKSLPPKIPGDFTKIIDLILKEIENYYNHLYILEDIRKTKSLCIIDKALQEKIDQLLNDIIILSRTIYPLKAINGLRSKDSKTRSDSIEVMDNVLKGQLKKLFICIFDDSPISGKIKIAEEYFGFKHLTLEENLNKLTESSDSWIRKCALYEKNLPQNQRKEKIMLTLIEEVLFLKGIKLFSELPTEEIAKIAKITEEKRFERGNTVFNEGDPGNALYIIIRGKVKLTKGQRQISMLKEGDCFGELELLDREPRTSKATVIEDAILSRLGSEEFYELLSDYPQIANGIFRVLTKKLKESYENI